MTVNDNPTNIKQYIRFFLVADVITIIASMAIGVFLFRRYAIQEHIKTAKGVTEYAAELIDIDRIPEFIEKGRDAAGYDETYAKLNRLTGIHPDVKFLYVLRMQATFLRITFIPSLSSWGSTVISGEPNPMRSLILSLIMKAYLCL